jgi:hypothetical protein
MASAGDEADLQFTRSLLNDSNVSYLNEVAVSDNPQLESVLSILLHYPSLIHDVG